MAAMQSSPKDQDTESGQGRKKFPAKDVSAYKAGQAGELAERLREGPEVLVDEENGLVTDHPTRYFADLLDLESSSSNHVVADLQHNEETYTQGIPLCRHSLRISPAYSQALRRRARALSMKAVERAEAALPHHEAYGFRKRYSWSYRWVHVVLTMAHPMGADAWGEVQRFNRAWAKFRKRQVYTGAVFAAVKGLEGKISWKGAHVHGHMLMLMRKVDLEAWIAAWRECLGGKAEEMVGGVHMRTIRTASNVRDPEHEETQASALEEICKYITKTEDLLDPDPETGRRVPWETLYKLCLPGRWPRMFELLGAAHPPATGQDWETQAIEPNEFCPGRRPGFTSIRREYLTAGPEQAEEWDENADGPLPWKWEYFGRRKGVGPAREPSWRSLMALMDRIPWLKVIQERVARAQRFRLKQIIARAIGPVIDLDGQIRTA